VVRPQDGLHARVDAALVGVVVRDGPLFRDEVDDAAQDAVDALDLSEVADGLIELGDAGGALRFRHVEERQERGARGGGEGESEEVAAAVAARGTAVEIFVIRLEMVGHDLLSL
jgi:hypothetical protein